MNGPRYSRAGDEFLRRVRKLTRPEDPYVSVLQPTKPEHGQACTLSPRHPSHSQTRCGPGHHDPSPRSTAHANRLCDHAATTRRDSRSTAAGEARLRRRDAGEPLPPLSRQHSQLPPRTVRPLRRRPGGIVVEHTLPYFFLSSISRLRR